MTPRAYLVRYGLARSVARFAVDPDSTDESLRDEPLDRGETVVIRTHRGTELGEVLGEAPLAFDSGEGNDSGRQARVAPLLRVASSEDLDQARLAEGRRQGHFDVCEAVFRDGVWPIEVIDAEPLLDEGRTVLHYLGPHRLDASGLVALFRDRHGLDVVLEPVGHDISDDELLDDLEPEEEADDHGCGSCGSKSSGGCGSCGSASGGCAIKALVGNRGKTQAEPAIIP